jgi:predicted PurR-regulated permease PerM
MDRENRIERTVGLVMLAVLAVGCLLVLRPFFTAVCFALILVVATWPAFDGLQRALGGRRTLAATLMVTLATLVFVLPPALVASRIDYNVAGAVQLVRDGTIWRTASPRRPNRSRRSSHGPGSS